MSLEFLHTLGISVWWKGVHLGLGNDLLFNSMQSERAYEYLIFCRVKYEYLATQEQMILFSFCKFKQVGFCKRFGGTAGLQKSDY